MNKILISTIIGLTITSVASASIISRGFFDEQMTNYATLNLLDSKANQSDITTLSNKIGTPDSTATYGEVAGRGTMSRLFYGHENDWFSAPFFSGQSNDINNIYDFLYNSYFNTEFPGVAGITLRLFAGWNDNFGLYDISNYFSDFIDEFPETDLYSLLITHGTTTGIGEKIYTLPQLSAGIDKIGTIPDGYTNLADALATVKITADTAKQLAEQAIPNVLNESSNGKYVLTAEKLGETATYRWEIIDRTTTETQTE